MPKPAHAALWMTSCFWLAASCGPPAELVPGASRSHELQDSPSLCPRFTYAREGRCVRTPWAELTAAPTNARGLADVQNVDGHRLWAVGAGGVLLRSWDGGATFGQIDPGTQADLIGVNTYDDRHLLITATDGLHVSDDGGVHFWHTAGPAGLGKCTYAPGATAICGDRAGGNVYRYHFRADRFETVATIPAAVQVLAHAGDRLVLAVGDTASDATILRSVDGGRSFVPLPATLPYPAVSVWVAGGDRRAFIGTGQGKIFVSGDGGLTFAPTFNPHSTYARRFNGAHLGGGDATHVFAAIQMGLIRNPTLMAVRSDDGGATWTDASSVQDGAALAGFGPGGQGLVLGDHIYRTLDGGATFAALDQQTFDAYRGFGFQFVRFLSREVGFAGYGTSPTSPYAPADSVLLRTDDGGATFTQLHLGGFRDRAVRSFAAPDAQHLFADLGLGVLRSTDGGTTWQPLTLPVGPSLAFATPELGLLAASAGPPWLYRTTDGGDTAAPVTLPLDLQVAAIAFADADHAVVAGSDGTLLYSEDGGQRFALARAGGAGEALSALSFAGGFGWTGGSAGGNVLLLRTHDFGRTWSAPQRAGAGAVTSVTAGGARRAAAVVVEATGQGRLIETEDGGTWHQVATIGDPLSVDLAEGAPATYLGTSLGVYREQHR